MFLPKKSRCGRSLQKRLTPGSYDSSLMRSACELAMPETACRCGKIETIANLYRAAKAYPLDLQIKNHALLRTGRL